MCNKFYKLNLFIVLVFLIVVISSEDLKCNNNYINTDTVFYLYDGKPGDDVDTITSIIERRNIYFYSKGLYYPFSLKIRGIGYFILGDIKYGFVDKDDEGDYIFEFGFHPPPNTVIKCYGRTYDYIEEIDTIYSFFSKRDTGKKNLIWNKQIRDTFKLSKELEYSFLLKETNNVPLQKTIYDEELRIIFPDETSMYFEKVHIMNVRFHSDSAQIFFSKINTGSAQNIEVIKTDSAWLNKFELMFLRERINNIDFSKISHLDNARCDGYNLRRHEYLVEYKKNGNYNYTVLCDSWGNIYPEEVELRTELLELKSLFYRFRKQHFHTPWYKRLWNRISG